MRNLTSWFEARRDLCFEILRIYLGIGLLVKGVLFASDPSLLPSMLAGGRLDAWATMIAHYVVLGHLVGGTLMAVGLFTRIAAAANVPILLGAVLFVHQADGLFTRSQNLEFTLFVLLALVLIVWYGSGRWSLDRVLFPARRPAELPGY